MPEDSTESEHATASEIFLELKALARAFAVPLSKEKRLIYYDGEELESVTDHTVMLGLSACTLAARFRPDLDIGLVAQYSLAHDLVEAYVGDTPTFKISPEQVADMKAAEEQGLVRIKSEWAAIFPWLVETIAKYEQLLDPETRYVRALDKLMPGITHFLNEGKIFRNYQYTMEDFEEWVKLNRDLIVGWDVFVGGIVDAFIIELRKHPEYFHQPK